MLTLCMQADVKADAAAKKVLDAAEQKKARAKIVPLSDAEQTETSEKERKARQAGQDKAAEKLRLENEAAAILAVSPMISFSGTCASISELY